VFQTQSLELGVAFNLRNLRLALDPIALRFGSLELLLRLGNLRLRAELGRLGVVAGVGANFIRLRLGVVGSFLRLRHRLLDILARRLRVRFHAIERLLRRRGVRLQLCGDVALIRL